MSELPTPKSLLPHREPFLLVDELTELVPGESVKGLWHVTGEEYFFPGHFPGRPTLPGVLMVEALAQAGACAALVDERFKGRIPLFGGVNNVKFRRQVVPGETLELSVTFAKKLDLAVDAARGTATVNGEVACTAELMVVLVEA